MENIIIRDAVINDYDAIENIMEQVQELHVTWRPDIYKHADIVFPIDYFKETLNNAIIMVAVKNHEVCAVMILNGRLYKSPTHIERNILFVDSMAVEKSCRGQGIGTKMFEYLIKLAKSKNYDGLELQVNSNNTWAKRMYEKCGFTEKSINMEITNFC